MKKILIGLAVGLIVGMVVVWGLGRTGMGGFSSEYSEGQLHVGDLAPDLELQRLDASGTAKFSNFYQEKPLVLVLGSYT